MSENNDRPRTIYQAINAITADLAKTGIAKSKKNQQQGFHYRGIDDLYNALAPLLAEHGVVIFPTVLERTVQERATKSGGAMFYVLLKVDLHFILSENPESSFRVLVYGEGMDSADKATNKALSAAYKYGCLTTFCIPVEGEPDADMETHELTSQPAIDQAALARSNKAQEMLARFEEAIRENDSHAFIALHNSVTEAQWDWVYAHLDEALQQWAAKVLE
jgi:hypothetical protein